MRRDTVGVRLEQKAVNKETHRVRLSVHLLPLTQEMKRTVVLRVGRLLHHRLIHKKRAHFLTLTIIKKIQFTYDC